MNKHKIVAYKGVVVSAQGRWICVCGTLMKETVFGHFLQREFAAHLKEKENGVERNYLSL